MTPHDQAEIAARFIAARRGARAMAGYPGDVPSTLDDAYAIQDRAIESWGQEVVGWKIGRVLPPYTERLGADRLAGPIFYERSALPDDPTPMPVFADGFAAGETEFLLRIGSELPESKTSFTLAEAAELIDSVHVGIEIASSPLATLNDLGPAAVVSDFGNNNGLLVGGRVEDWRTSGFEDWTVVVSIDGEEQLRGTAATSFPDGPMGAARFLFELMARRGIRLRPGQWISSGAVGGVRRAGPGQVVEARFGDDLTVRCRLVAAQ